MIEGACHCGAVRWSFDGVPTDATASNCTICRRYGALWAYDWEGERIRVSGPARAYVRGKTLGFHFCTECACVAYWRALKPGGAPEAVAGIVIDHFDGLNTFDDLPRDGRCVADIWF